MLLRLLLLSLSSLFSKLLHRKAKQLETDLAIGWVDIPYDWKQLDWMEEVEDVNGVIMHVRRKRTSSPSRPVSGDSNASP